MSLSHVWKESVLNAFSIVSASHAFTSSGVPFAHVIPLKHPPGTTRSGYPASARLGTSVNSATTLCPSPKNATGSSPLIFALTSDWEKIPTSQCPPRTAGINSFPPLKLTTLKMLSQATLRPYATTPVVAVAPALPRVTFPGLALA